MAVKIKISYETERELSPVLQALKIDELKDHKTKRTFSGAKGVHNHVYITPKKPRKPPDIGDFP